MGCRDCFGRTPFGSLIAAICVCIGVGLFCATLNRALQITLVGLFENLFQYPVPWLQTIQVLFTVVAVVMGCFAIILLVFGFLATGATRQNLYSGAKCIMGGRVSAGFFLGLSYVLNFLWMCVSSVCAMPIIAYIMLNSICVNEIQDRPEWYYENYCLNLSRFGIYFNTTEGVRRNAICDEFELSDFCQLVQDAGPMYGIALGASLIVVLGMCMFLVVLANNYDRIKLSKELTDYRDAVDLELSDAQIVTNQKSY